MASAGHLGKIGGVNPGKRKQGKTVLVGTSPKKPEGVDSKKALKTLPVLATRGKIGEFIQKMEGGSFRDRRRNEN